ncbi:MAG: FAD-dependent oxidoreductase [Clostridiaceae bacterium]|nr:FAD-dependent oxidoreductase [Clostridiaceae bacterium]
MREADIVIIGGGPAGMAAAIEASKNGNKNIVLLERDRTLGGILQQCVHNGFGLHLFGEELTGPEYAERFIRQINELDIDVKLDTMVFDISKDKVVTAVNSEDGLIKLKARSIVLSTGCRERTRGALNIPGTRPAGIYTAGTAQRFVNMEGYMPGRKVVILGSGDIGLIMARRMTLEGAEVKMVCELMPYSGGLKRNIVQCLDDYNIPLKLSHTVVEIHGRERLEGVTVAKADEQGRPVDGTYEYVECDTLLLSVGLIPENELIGALPIEMDGTTSGPVVDESAQTSCEGIFACGNSVYVHDLVDYVTLEGYKAGKCAAEYVASLSSGSNAGSDVPVAGVGAKGTTAAEPKDMIRIKSGHGIRSVVPQQVHRECREDVRLFFRVGGIYHNAAFAVDSGDKTLHSVKRRIVTPGEMESIILTADMISKIKGDTVILSMPAGQEKGGEVNE